VYRRKACRAKAIAVRLRQSSMFQGGSSRSSVIVAITHYRARLSVGHLQARRRGLTMSVGGSA